MNPKALFFSCIAIFFCTASAGRTNWEKLVEMKRDTVAAEGIKYAAAVSSALIPAPTPEQAEKIRLGNQLVSVIAQMVEDLEGGLERLRQYPDFYDNVEGKLNGDFSDPDRVILAVAVALSFIVHDL